MKVLPKLEDFPSRTFDKLRFGDTDKQGHVNNAVFVTFLETGRTALREEMYGSEGHHFVTARLVLDYVGEVFWPGTVEIGTGVKSIGNSSTTFLQAIFQNGKCVASAEVVMVQVDRHTHRPVPVSQAVRELLSSLIMPA